MARKKKAQQNEVVTDPKILEKYVPKVHSPSVVAMNRILLSEIGCSDAQIQQFATREYAALPLWIRKALKKKLGKQQNIPQKANPAQGEAAFYINKYRFQPQRQPA